MTERVFYIDCPRSHWSSGQPKPQGTTRRVEADLPMHTRSVYFLCGNCHSRHMINLDEK